MGPTIADLPPMPLFTSLSIPEPDEPRWIVEVPAHWTHEMVEQVRKDIDQAIESGSSVLVLPDGAYLRPLRPEPYRAEPVMLDAVSTGFPWPAALSIIALLLSVVALLLAARP